MIIELEEMPDNLYQNLFNLKLSKFETELKLEKDLIANLESELWVELRNLGWDLDSKFGTEINN